jgi:hypothetical protein
LLTRLFLLDLVSVKQSECGEICVMLLLRSFFPPDSWLLRGEQM